MLIKKITKPLFSEPILVPKTVVFLQAETSLYVTKYKLVYLFILCFLVSQQGISSLSFLLDKSINLLPWDLKSLEFSKSDINAYLNDHFLNLLDKEYLDIITEQLVNYGKKIIEKRKEIFFHV